MSKYQILLMPGEGIGPEIVREGERVLRAISDIYSLDVEITEHVIGESVQATTGYSMYAATQKLCDELQTNPNAGILFGAVSNEPIGILRKRYDLFANLRPIRAYPQISFASPLRPERVQGTDIMIVRELVSDIYYGDYSGGFDKQGRWAQQAMYYHETEMRRITRKALEVAQQRRKKLHFVHKGNVLIDIFGIWRSVLKEESLNYPDVECQEILVDNMAMQMVLQPTTFDVLLCSNLFGDILSDLGAGVVGSIGLLPSASINEHGFGLYESIGGTAPTIAGQNKANPLSTILSVAMMCRHTFKNEAAAQAIEAAVERVLSEYRTADLYEPGCTLVSTSDIGSQVIANLGV